MTRLLAILIVILTGATTWAQDSVRLRHLAIVDPDAPVTLSMIADLEGEHAETLANVVIIDAPHAELAGGAREATIDVERVRAALRAHPAVDWSTLLLRGAPCVVRPEGLIAPPEDRTRSTTRSAPVSASTISTTSLKGHVALAVARALGVQTTDLRLTFDPRDAHLLATSALGRTVDASVIGRSDDVPVRVIVYERDRILLSETVRVEASVRRDVCVLTATRRRDEAIGREDFAIERRWLAPTDEPIGPETAVGLSPRTTLRAGDALLRRDAELPTIVERGDVISVHCVSGSVVIQMPARALEDGRDGDVIQFEHLRGDSIFLARMSGKGRAVAIPAEPVHPDDLTKERRP